ncbi:ORF2 [Indomegoura indica nege-like virus 1]|nr:ORF2 [Indomegoura indica nege-like virus 1]
MSNMLNVTVFLLRIIFHLVILTFQWRRTCPVLLMKDIILLDSHRTSLRVSLIVRVVKLNFRVYFMLMQLNRLTKRLRIFLQIIFIKNKMFIQSRSFLFPFIHFFFLNIIHNVNTSDLLSIFFSKHTLPVRNFITEAIRYDLVEIGVYHSSPFVFDSECISVIGTNTFLEHPCTLPPKCGRVAMSKKTTGIFGNEIIVCYSFHPTFDNLPITFFQIVPTTTLMSISTDDESIYLKDLIPTDFFEHFVVVISPKFFVIPRICLDGYTSVGETLPDSVKLDVSSDIVTISHSRFNETQCHPMYMSGVEEFVRTFDYPIAYKGCSYSLSNHEKYRNQDPFVGTYHMYYSLHGMKPYVYSIKQQYNGDSIVFYAHAPLSEFQRYKHFNYDVDMNTTHAHFIYSDGKKFSAFVTTHSFPVSYLYRSPFTIFIEHLKNLFEYIFQKFLYLFRQEATEIVKLFIYILNQLILYIFNDLIITTVGINFYTYLIFFSMLYFYFSDFTKALIFISVVVITFEVVF